MATTIRTPATASKAGTGSVSTHWFKFKVGATGAVTAASLKQGGDGAVASIARAGLGRYTITLTSPNIIEILNCRVSVAKAAQTDAVIIGNYKVDSLTAGAVGTPQTFEVFFTNTSAAAADVVTGGEVHVEFVEALNKTMGQRVDN